RGRDTDRPCRLQLSTANLDQPLSGTMRRVCLRGENMNKFWRLSMGSVLAAAAMLLGQAASAQNQDFSKVEIKVTKVSGTIYRLEGGSGDMAAAVVAEGIVV